MRLHLAWLALVAGKKAPMTLVMHSPYAWLAADARALGVTGRCGKEGRGG